MAPVQGTIDIQQELEEVKKTHQGKLLFFIDSIYLRILINTNLNEEKIIEKVKTIIERKLNEEQVYCFEMVYHKIPDHIELKWEIKHGYVFHPSFFAFKNANAPKGMHGYSEHNSEDLGFYAIVCGKSNLRGVKELPLHELINEFS